MGYSFDKIDNYVKYFEELKIKSYDESSIIDLIEKEL